jgi:hypothetical protein
MITKIYFETFASGMKARLDPAYRQGHEIRGWHNSAVTLRKETRGSQNTFVPFANVKKAF